MTSFITVAIPYVNAAPHLGYAYELVEADIVARSRRRAGQPVRFLGGTDDHSLKNVLAAEAAGRPTAEFVREHADRFERLAGPLDLSFDDFVRTSDDPRHRPAVERLWHACAAAGDLYRRAYEGDYCVGCEQFYDPADLIEGRCPEHGTLTERVAEQNWFFRLSRYTEQLAEAIAADRLVVRPEPFRDEILAFVRAGLRDISVSRSVNRARSWGIPVPDDPTQVVYVWFDALTNYISSLGYGNAGSADQQRWWDGADQRIHVVGKGILRFHAVFWPAFLLSAGLELPTRIQVHPYLTVDGAKLSKSSGNTVDPVEIVERFGSDAVRWWFARDVGATSDTDFTIDRLVQRFNEDLANGLGNVVNRIVTLVHRHRDGRVPDAGVAPIPEAAAIERLVDERLAEFDLRGATADIVDAIAALNRDLERTQPWKVAARGDDPDQLDLLLDRYVTSVAAIASACAPIVPVLSARVTARLDRRYRLPAPSPVAHRIELAST